MSRSPTHDLRYISLCDQGNYIAYMVRVGLATKQCNQEVFNFNQYGSKTKALKAAKRYRNKEEKRLKQVYGLRFDLGWNPKKESVYLNSCIKNVTEYFYFVASVWDKQNYKQLKKTYSVNKYGTRQAKKLAYEWRDKKRIELYGKT